MTEDEETLVEVMIDAEVETTAVEEISEAATEIAEMVAVAETEEATVEVTEAVDEMVAEMETEVATEMVAIGDVQILNVEIPISLGEIPVIVAQPSDQKMLVAVDVTVAEMETEEATVEVTEAVDATAAEMETEVATGVDPEAVAQAEVEAVDEVDLAPGRDRNRRAGRTTDSNIHRKIRLNSEINTN